MSKQEAKRPTLISPTDTAGPAVQVRERILADIEARDRAVAAAKHHQQKRRRRRRIGRRVLLAGLAICVGLLVWHHHDGGQRLLDHLLEAVRSPCRQPAPP